MSSSGASVSDLVCMTYFKYSCCLFGTFFAFYVIFMFLKCLFTNIK